jgi:hypothetical protein
MILQFASWIQYKKKFEKFSRKFKKQHDHTAQRVSISSAHQPEKGGPTGAPVRFSVRISDFIKKTWRPLASVQYDFFDHMPSHNQKPLPLRCKNDHCTFQSHLFCEKCQVHLCLNRNYFKNFHQKKAH